MTMNSQIEPASTKEGSPTPLQVQDAPTVAKKRCYRRKGKFDFLGLPMELRDMIYEELIRAQPAAKFYGHFNRPGRGTKRVRVKPSEEAEPDLDSTITTKYMMLPVPPVRTARLRSHGLLYTCRQIYSEYQPVLSAHAKPTLHLNPSSLIIKDNRLRISWPLSTSLKENVRVFRIDVHFIAAGATAFHKPIKSHQKAIAKQLRLLIEDLPKLIKFCLTLGKKVQTLERRLTGNVWVADKSDPIRKLFKRVCYRAVSAKSSMEEFYVHDGRHHEIFTSAVSGGWDFSIGSGCDHLLNHQMLCYCETFLYSKQGHIKKSQLPDIYLQD
jgi:hypothetical protein